MKVFIEKEQKTVQLKAKTARDILKKLKISEDNVVIVRNSEVILCDELLEDSDEIKLLSVVSGG